VEALEGKGGSVSSTDRYHYTPYGDLEMGAGELGQVESSGNFSNATPENSLAADAQANKYRFEGFCYDSGVQTYDMLARPYRPSNGQFLVSDRFEQALGDQQLAADPLTQNRYAFAGGNPTSNVEYDGHGCIPTDPSDPTHYHYCSAGGGYSESSQTNPSTGQTTNTTSGPTGVIRSVTTGPGSSSGSASSAPAPSARAVAPAPSLSALEQQIRATNAALSGASTAGAVAQAKAQLAQLKAQLATALVNEFKNSCSNQVSGAQAIAFCNFANSGTGQALASILGPIGAVTRSAFGAINTGSNLVFWGCVGTGDPFCAGAAEGISALTGAAREIGSTTDPLIESSSATVGGIGPVLKGQAGVAHAIGQIAAEGGNTLGSGEITIDTPVGRTRIDLVEQTASGDRQFVEVKNGPFAQPNPNQKRVFAYIRQFGGTPVGQRTAEAGFTPGEPIGPTPVEMRSYP
jgi:RHS repeat-associated protein